MEYNIAASQFESDNKMIGLSKLKRAKVNTSRHFFTKVVIKKLYSKSELSNFIAL